MKIKNLLFISSLLLIGSSCNNNNFKREKVWVPIYKDKAVASEITNLSPQKVSAGGKIYTYGTYIFQLEQNQGIHVFRLENRKPVPVSFIQVYGAQEISIKNNFLYTNNFSDLVSIDISNISNVSINARIANAFNMQSFNTPPAKGFFQCVDSTKGVVVGWELQKDVEARCIY